jgi:hypothetical protein
MKNTIHKINNLSRNKKVGLSTVAAALLAGGLVIGCGGGGDTATSNFVATADPVITGTDLYCDGVDRNSDGTLLYVSVDAADYNDSNVSHVNVSSTSSTDGNRSMPNANNTLVRMGMAIDPLTASGESAILLHLADTNDTKVRPLLISYAEQVVGGYEMGDGSADIGDPTHLDDIFVSLSRDDGETWKKYQLSDFAKKLKSSIDVKWDMNDDNVTETTRYPGHNVKPTMVVSGDNILVAWHSKYCPSGNPFGLTPTDDTNTSYADDFFQVNGKQGSIDYTAKDGTIMVAPNGKKVFEVPFSCIWTARGVFDASNAENPIIWRAPEQLTTGRRDANKVTIATAAPGVGSDDGFAITWQEDPKGLRSGKGEGPGDGWSGATTNHGADIWYSMIKMENFAETNGVVDTKPKPKYSFSYPIRITDNEKCQVGDTKLYCQALCDEFGSEDGICNTGERDMLDNERVHLNGDTGASRPTLNILKTNEGQYVVVLGYEETKGLSAQATPDDENDIALEGKSVYYESFPFTQIPAPADVTLDILNQIPMVSSGNIINVKVPRDGDTAGDPADDIYENARRLTFIPQIDACEPGEYTYGWMYKQGFDTQGSSSDMYIRMNTGFGAETLYAYTPKNISSLPLDGSEWTTANLDDQSYTNGVENTFSPRGFIRGNDIFIGYEYTPNATLNAQGHSPNNFYIHRYALKEGSTTEREWKVPQNLTNIDNNLTSTLDPRFVATPKGRHSTTGLESDKSNPDVMFMTFGTFDMSLGIEMDLYYTRSTNRGVTWEMPMTKGDTNASVLSKRSKIIGDEVQDDSVESKEVQSLSTPDGKRLFNTWLQESEHFDPNDHFQGLDTWFGRIDYTKPE